MNSDRTIRDEVMFALRAGLVIGLVFTSAALACSIDWRPGQRRPSRVPSVDLPPTVLVERGSIEARVRSLESQLQDLRADFEAGDRVKGGSR